MDKLFMILISRAIPKRVFVLRLEGLYNSGFLVNSCHSRNLLLKYTVTCGL